MNARRLKRMALAFNAPLMMQRNDTTKHAVLWTIGYEALWLTARHGLPIRGRACDMLCPKQRRRYPADAPPPPSTNVPTTTSMMKTTAERPCNVI